MGRYLEKVLQKTAGGEKVAIFKLGARTLLEFGRIEILKHIAKVLSTLAILI